jgi:uncharacterized Zn finger protein
MSGEPHPDQVASAPTRCPTCGSQDLKTASKVITTETYWRCGKCGEVWNVGRRRATDRYVPDRRWRH